MSKLIVAVLSSLLAVSVALAQTPAAPAKAAPAAPAAAKPAAPAAAVAPAPAAASDCEARAVSKAGKPLAGGAKAAFMKKCEADAKGTKDSGSGCEAKAVSKAGKPLAGAAKAASIKKCEADAKAGK